MAHGGRAIVVSLKSGLELGAKASRGDRNHPEHRMAPSTAPPRRKQFPASRDTVLAGWPRGTGGFEINPSSRYVCWLLVPWVWQFNPSESPVFDVTRGLPCVPDGVSGVQDCTLAVYICSHPRALAASWGPVIRLRSPRLHHSPCPHKASKRVEWFPEYRKYPWSLRLGRNKPCYVPSIVHPLVSVLSLKANWTNGTVNTRTFTKD